VDSADIADPKTAVVRKDDNNYVLNINSGARRSDMVGRPLPNGPLVLGSAPCYVVCPRTK
nr:hypothetical protein [Victivallales bacterium]